MAKKFPLNPKSPERICWGCDRYCPTGDMACGNGSGRTQHPAELLGEDWYLVGDWGLEDAPPLNAQASRPRDAASATTPPTESAPPSSDPTPA